MTRDVLENPLEQLPDCKVHAHIYIIYIIYTRAPLNFDRVELIFIIYIYLFAVCVFVVIFLGTRDRVAVLLLFVQTQRAVCWLA